MQNADISFTDDTKIAKKKSEDPDDQNEPLQLRGRVCFRRG